MNGFCIISKTITYLAGYYRQLTKLLLHKNNQYGTELI